MYTCFTFSPQKPKTSLNGLMQRQRSHVMYNASSHFRMESRDETAVGSRELGMKRYIFISLMVINDHCHGSVEISLRA